MGDFPCARIHEAHRTEGSEGQGLGAGIGQGLHRLAGLKGPEDFGTVLDPLVGRDPLAGHQIVAKLPIGLGIEGNIHIISPPRLSPAVPPEQGGKIE